MFNLTLFVLSFVDNDTLDIQLNFTSSMLAAVYYNDTSGIWEGDGCSVSTKPSTLILIEI